MKPSFWITLLASVTICIVAVVAQAARNKSLAQRLAEEQAKPAPAGLRQQAPSASPDRRQLLERIDHAVAEIGELMPGAAEADPDDPLAAVMGIVNKEKSYKGVFLDFLRSVEDLSVDELVSVAGKTPDAKFKKWLMILAAEQDPERILRNEEWKGRLSTRQMAEALASADPDAALRLLPPLEPRSPDDGTIYLMGEPRLDAWVRVATKLLGTERDLGLQAFLEIHESLAGANKDRIPMGRFGSLGIPALPEGSVPGVIEAMNEPQYAEIRDDLLRMTVTHLMFEGGVPAVIDRAESMQLTQEELKYAIGKMQGLGGLSSDPEPLIDWISDVQPNRLPSAFVDWAELDLAGATTWLGSREPSPVRDQTIARFAGEASKLDPQAAANWANEIKNDKLRNETLRRVESR